MERLTPQAYVCFVTNDIEAYYANLFLTISKLVAITGPDYRYLVIYIILHNVVIM